MTTEHPVAQSDRRTSERLPLDGKVEICFAEQAIVGPGQNISGEGVFFVAEGAVHVRVHIEGRDEWRVGEVVRVQAMGEGQIGIAVKFTDG